MYGIIIIFARIYLLKDIHLLRYIQARLVYMNNGKNRYDRPKGRDYGLTVRRYAGFVNKYPDRKDISL